MNRWWPIGLGRYVMSHPRDLAVLLGAAWRLRRREWWRRRPFLPLPDPLYWDFRLSTVSGASTYALTPSAAVEAARWARTQRSKR